MTDVEHKLAVLEKPGQEVAATNRALAIARLTGDPSTVTVASERHDAAVAAYKSHAAQFETAGGLERVIAEHAQAVLDERGEAHTEKNILPEGLTLPVVEAQTARALALTSGNKAKIAAAEAALVEAIKTSDAERLNHAASGLDAHFRDRG